MYSKRSIVVTLVVAMLLGMFTLAASPAMALSADESQFVSSHNSIRSQNGRRTLGVASDLVTVARRHSARMASEGRIWHNPNLTREVDNWSVVGENVGKGPSVPDLMDAFMASTGHRNNILDSDYNYFGVGVVVSDGTIFVTVVFVQRRSSGGSTTTAPRTTTTRPRTTTTRSSTTARPRPAARPAATAAPAAPPAPAPLPVRTVSMLERMIRLDH